VLSGSDLGQVTHTMCICHQALQLGTCVKAGEVTAGCGLVEEVWSIVHDAGRKPTASSRPLKQR